MFEAIIDLLEHPERYENKEEYVRNEKITSRSYKQAVAAIDDYLSSDSQNKEALAIKIRLLQCQHRVAYAKHVAKSLLMLGGEDSKYLDTYGSALLQAGDFEDAETIFLRSYKLDPDGPYGFGQKVKLAKELNRTKKDGNEKVSKGALEDAIAVYTRGVEKCREQQLLSAFVFLNNRSACYMNNGRYTEALADIDESIRLNPFLPKPYLRRITCVNHLQLADRMSSLPTDYVDALYASGFKNCAKMQVEYLSFLRQKNAFKTNVNPVSSQRDLNRVIEINPNTLIVLDMYASWCRPCKLLAPQMDDMSVTHPTVVFLKIDADKERDVAQQFHVEGFPTVVLLKNGKELDRVVGCDPDKVQDLVNKHMGLEMDMVPYCGVC